MSTIFFTLFSKLTLFVKAENKARVYIRIIHSKYIQGTPVCFFKKLFSPCKYLILKDNGNFTLFWFQLEHV